MRSIKYGLWPNMLGGGRIPGATPLAMMYMALGLKSSEGFALWSHAAYGRWPWVCSPKAMVIIARGNAPGGMPQRAVFANGDSQTRRRAGCRSPIDAATYIRLNMAFGQTCSGGGRIPGATPQAMLRKALGQKAWGASPSWGLCCTWPLAENPRDALPFDGYVLPGPRKSCLYAIQLVNALLMMNPSWQVALRHPPTYSAKR